MQAGPTLRISDDAVEKAFDRLRFGARKAAQAKANRLYMIEYRKVVKSICMAKNLGQPLAAQERDAYSDPEYIKHLDAMRAAIEADEQAHWEMVAAEATIEAWRTESANQRGMVKIG